MSKPAFIVEGHSDVRQVKGALGENDYITIVTNGTKVNNSLITKIEESIRNGYTPYILSDPDVSGDQLASMIQSRFPNMERINADFEECRYCKDLKRTKFKAGIEYSSYKYLRKLLYPYLGAIYIDTDTEWIFL